MEGKEGLKGRRRKERDSAGEGEGGVSLRNEKLCYGDAML